MILAQRTESDELLLTIRVARPKAMKTNIMERAMNPYYRTDY